MAARGESVLEAAETLGTKCMGLRCDVADRASVEQAIGSVVQNWGQIDCVVNNAGTHKGGKIHRLTMADWQTVLDTNLTGAMNITALASEHMGEGGSIINAGAVVGFRGFPGDSAYAAAVSLHTTHFARAKPDSCIHTFTGDKLHSSACTSSNLRSATGLELDSVNGRTDGDVGRRKAITRLNGRFASRHNRSTHCNTFGSENITTLSICIFKQCNIRCAIRIVFQTFYNRRNSIFISLEIDNAVATHVTTTNMARRDATLIVTAT